MAFPQLGVVLARQASVLPYVSESRVHARSSFRLSADYPGADGRSRGWRHSRAVSVRLMGQHSRLPLPFNSKFQIFLCLLLALFGHPTCTDACPLSGVKRTSLSLPRMSANDPKRTSLRK